MMTKQGLKVSEHFYSLQGEGSTAGYPAVFLRLTGCILNCVWCDTLEVWRRGTMFSFEELLDIFEKEGYRDKLDSGARLIVTGGDPLIQQNEFTHFVKLLREKMVIRTPFFVTECETEGCLMPHPATVTAVDQFNVSPKLANSGIIEFKRIQKDVLHFHAGRPYDIFKFPVETVSDLREVSALVNMLRIPKYRVYLMPVCNDRNEFHRLAPKVADWCKDTGWNFSPRLQLVLWDRSTGV